ncbi:hypothetical protein [Rhodobacteraceae bacterium DSL-40]|uniref:hypothetical protein n=1 Tax=Amaricoccus sp. B4 TaxID=3368557 RepID=UPI000DAC9124
MLRISLFGAAALVLAACSEPSGGTSGTEVSQADAGSGCVARFQYFDTVKATMSTPTGRDDRASVPAALQFPIARLQQAGCMTKSADLTLEGPVVPVVNSGSEIGPTMIHAGVVTDMGDDGRAKRYFEARGVTVRSIGQPGLGRRVYLGPFTTQGALDAAMEASREGGFAYPYVTTFVG